jgi:hypothetical protein
MSKSTSEFVRTECPPSLQEQQLARGEGEEGIVASTTHKDPSQRRAERKPEKSQQKEMKQEMKTRDEQKGRQRKKKKEAVQVKTIKLTAYLERNTTRGCPFFRCSS